MIKIQCPGCGHNLGIGDEYAGLKGKCKYCKESFMVPSDSAPYVPLVDPGADEVSEHRYAKGRSNFLVPILARCAVVVVLFGLAFWWMQEDEIQSTSIDPELVGNIESYSTVKLAGASVAEFGKAKFSETVASVPASGPLNMLTKKQLQCYRTTVDTNYEDAVSDYQLALTELSWDFVIVDSKSGDWTELFGTVDGHEVCMRINRSKSDTNTEIIFTTNK